MTARASSEVGVEAVLLSIMPVRAGGAAYSVGRGGRGKKGSWCKYQGSKMNRG